LYTRIVGGHLKHNWKNISSWAVSLPTIKYEIHHGASARTSAGA
jgi:hypothetical protein